ncbi:Peptidase S12, Pab87-related, C-terminal [Penicillium italicum]|uniref:Peptidase S12, Pab87-related, C-terminal n=1 Tax=Penicillium italicum TaxID=40296 RepID=A0A0A2L588_PENIT|nr:Peptidase S12, Pab87-related, C-terminal [Penicillium italicum]
MGFRDTESSVEPDSDTLYGIASISKVFTASAIGILVDEGKLNWTTPIVSIIPELATVDKTLTEQLTIIDLLTHRTGQANSNNWWFGSGGALLLKKSQTVSAFNALKQTDSFRTGFKYSNWGFALVGEVIERLTGVSYGDFLQSRIFGPLEMHRTTTKHTFQTTENFAKPYAALDDKSMYLLPPPPIQDDTVMVAAQGIQSSVNDLLKFSNALLAARKGNVESPLKNTEKQFAGHIFRDAPFLDKSYGLGLMRATLPGSIGGGSSGMYADLPIITPGTNSNTRLVTFHGGSQVGYTSFFTMLPESEISIVILTNSIGLGDPTCWIHELLIETLVESPNRTDFVQLATEAAQNAIASIPKMQDDFNQSRDPDSAPSHALENFVGRYYDKAHDFVVEIRKKDTDTLQVAFQGLDSQVWDLQHYQLDTFIWLQSRDNIMKRARFPYAGKNLYTLIFLTGPDGRVDGLLWPHDPNLSAQEQYFQKLASIKMAEPEVQESVKAV